MALVLGDATKEVTKYDDALVAFKRVTEGIFPFRPPRKARSPS